jgi:hypothetical protein
MSSVSVAKRILNCTHCGREVAETRHTRSSYRVDYYALHTGEVEPTTQARSDDPTALVSFLKLLRPTEVVTCVDCYRQPHVRARREVLFRPELFAPRAREATP